MNPEEQLLMELLPQDKEDDIVMDDGALEGLGNEYEVALN
jgi:hypothetical protein